MKKTHYRNDFSKSKQIDNIMTLIIGLMSAALIIRIIVFLAFKI